MQDWKLALVVGGVALGGVAVGATFFGARPAAAQTGPYTRCIIARQESLDTHDDGSIEAPTAARTINVPTGWEPIAGGGVEPNHWHGAIILCHR